MTKTPSSFFSQGIKPRGLFTAAGVVASGATVLGFFGRLWWFSDLLSHFRVQYFLALLVLGILLLIGHRCKTAAVFLLLASVNFAAVLPLYFDKPIKTTAESPAMRAMLLNVNTHRGDANRVKAVVSKADPDILVLEEISSGWMSDLNWITNSYPHSLAHPREDNFGIGLFSKLPLADAEVVYIGAADVPSILATITLAHTNLRVIATHPLPPLGRDYSWLRNMQLEKLPDFIQSAFPTLLLGDLNVTPWNYHFRRLLARTGLLDSAKGFGVQPTWPTRNPLLWIPIDHCLHSADITIVDRTIGQSVSSDHYPVIVDFVIGDKQSDKGPPR